MRLQTLAIAALCGTWLGCGTTKWTDSARSATEQLLISDAMDRAVSQVDFRSLAGKKVFIDDTAVKTMTDNAYLTSTVRQHVLASGGILKEPKDQADYVVELRAGAIGTDHHDVLFGVPATTLPALPLVTGVAATSIPEIAVAKKTDQRAVAKIAVFVYNRQTGRIVWQSGIVPEESRAKALWVLGAGPFQRGEIYNGTRFAGDSLNIPLVNLRDDEQDEANTVSVADQAFFVEPKDLQAPTPTAATPAAGATPPVVAPTATPAQPVKGSPPPAGPSQSTAAATPPADAAKPATPAAVPQPAAAPNVTTAASASPGSSVVQAGLLAPGDTRRASPLYTPLIAPDDRDGLPTVGADHERTPFDGRLLGLPRMSNERGDIWGVDPPPRANYLR